MLGRWSQPIRSGWERLSWCQHPSQLMRRTLKRISTTFPAWRQTRSLVRGSSHLVFAAVCLGSWTSVWRGSPALARRASTAASASGTSGYQWGDTAGQPVSCSELIFACLIIMIYLDISNLELWLCVVNIDIFNVLEQRWGRLNRSTELVWTRRMCAVHVGGRGRVSGWSITSPGARVSVRMSAQHQWPWPWTRPAQWPMSGPGGAPGSPSSLVSGVSGASLPGSASSLCWS